MGRGRLGQQAVGGQGTRWQGMALTEMQSRGQAILLEPVDSPRLHGAHSCPRPAGLHAAQLHQSPLA